MGGSIVGICIIMVSCQLLKKARQAHFVKYQSTSSPDTTCSPSIRGCVGSDLRCSSATIEPPWPLLVVRSDSGVASNEDPGSS